VEPLKDPNHLGKQEAVDLLNEIVKRCVLPKFIALEASNPKAPSEKQNYVLRIGKSFDAETWSCLKGIVKEKNLNMKEIGDYVIIYRQES
jgi:hypothetical protein